MKPLGIGLTINEKGIGMSVTRPSQVEDAIWEAVQAAIEAGWSANQFRIEAAEAWHDRLTRDAKDGRDELMR